MVYGFVSLLFNNEFTINGGQKDALNDAMKSCTGCRWTTCASTCQWPLSVLWVCHGLRLTEHSGRMISVSGRIDYKPLNKPWVSQLILHTVWPDVKKSFPFHGLVAISLIVVWVTQWTAIDQRNSVSRLQSSQCINQTYIGENYGMSIFLWTTSAIWKLLKVVLEMGERRWESAGMTTSWTWPTWWLRAM